MLKKVVLSSLLSVSMVFSISVPVGAERNNDIKTCKQACWLMKNYEKQNMNKIKKLEEEKNSIANAKDEVKKEYLRKLIEILGNPNFDKNEKDAYLWLEISLSIEDNKINLYNDMVELTENATRDNWKNFHKVCPTTFCKGSKYDEENNSSVAQNNFSLAYLKNLTSPYLNNTKNFFGSFPDNWKRLKSLFIKTPIEKLESEFAKAKKAKHRAEEEFERAHYDVNKAEDNLIYVRNAEEAACIDSEMENKNQVCARLKRESYNAQKMLDAAQENLRVAEIKRMFADHYAKEKEEELKAIRAKAESCGENEFYNANTNTCECKDGFLKVDGNCEAKV